MKLKFYSVILLLCALACDDSGNSLQLEGTGKAGSLARFALSATHLYAVDEQSLNVYRFTTNGALEKITNSHISVNIETIFIKDSYLYIGAQDAMRIFDITDPDKPTYKSIFPHVLACDPVVVQDTLAFITYRVNNCRNFGLNAVEILNVKDPEKPVSLSKQTLANPYGLGVKNNLLFICEGNEGLKIFDIANPRQPALITTYFEIHAYDIIVNTDTIILTGSDGVTQYAYTPLGELKQLSHISID